MKIIISEGIKNILPEFNVIGYTMDVSNELTEDVTKYIEEVISSNKDIYTLEQIIKEPKLIESRNGYKKLGKDPSHTRLACENLWRRMIKGQAFYRLGDLIDLGNILSLLTNRSVCVVDYNKVIGDVVIREGKENEPYLAINRGPLNIHHLPAYCDELSPFGTPTSDTDRTKVDESTHTILIMIICFGEVDKQKDEELMLELYQKYAGARHIRKIEVEYGKF